MRVRKNVPNEREMVIQVVLHTADKLNTLSGSAENVVLQCYVYSLPIRERTENWLRSGWKRTLVLVTEVRLKSRANGKSDLGWGQPAVGSGREVEENERDEDGKDRWSTLNAE
jgi:hypothetical protein